MPLRGNAAASFLEWPLGMPLFVVGLLVFLLVLVFVLLAAVGIVLFVSLAGAGLSGVILRLARSGLLVRGRFAGSLVGVVCRMVLLHGRFGLVVSGLGGRARWLLG